MFTLSVALLDMVAAAAAKMKEESEEARNAITDRGARAPLPATLPAR
jgi:hypothetical protein